MKPCDLSINLGYTDLAIPHSTLLSSKMRLRLWILAGIIAAAHADASMPRRFLSDDPSDDLGETTCVDGAIDKTGLPCLVCAGESASNYCDCDTDCRFKPDYLHKFCACAEAQACCECRDSDAWAKTDDPDKGCAWVAELPGVPGDWKRCRAKGVIDRVEINQCFGCTRRRGRAGSVER